MQTQTATSAEEKGSSAGAGFQFEENCDNIRTLSVKLAQRLCLPRATAYECVNCVFSILSSALRSGSKVSIKNFGSFEARTTGPRKIFVPSKNAFEIREPKKTVRFSSKLRF